MAATDSSAAVPDRSEAGLRLATADGRWAVAVTVLGSSMVFLDATVVNIALPAIGRDLDASVASLQWTVNSYLLALAALIILGGSFGDRFGRRRVFLIGTIWFTGASALCGLAPSDEALIAARVLQGVGGALLTPGSLAIIEASFAHVDRGRAIGLWSGLAGVSTAAGPLVGGYLIDAVSWRAVFYLNLPIGAFVAATAMRRLPETFGNRARRIDVAGASLVAIGLAGTSLAMTEAPELGVGSAAVVVSGSIGTLALITFVLVERRVTEPMLPLGIFRSRPFAAANLVTFVVYAALAGVFFFLGVFLQISLRYSPLEAGMAGVPVTALLLVLSARAGALAQRIGARPLLTGGALVMALAMLMMRSIEPGDDYLAGVLPSIALFGLGLAAIVAPVTATALSSAPVEHAGLASAVNNAVSRAGQLIAIAILPAVAGLAGSEYANPAALTDAFHTAMIATAILALIGGAIAWTMIGREVLLIGPPAE
ncbi:MAG: MFS transporter [Solirubrobacterales bacterium]